MSHVRSRNFALATQRQVAKTESYGAFVAIDGFERHGLVNIGQASTMQQAKLNTAARPAPTPLFRHILPDGLS